MQKRITRWIAAVLVGIVVVSCGHFDIVKAEESTVSMEEENSQQNVETDNQEVEVNEENSDSPEENVQVSDEGSDESLPEKDGGQENAGEEQSNESNEAEVVNEPEEEEKTIEPSLNYLYINEAEQDGGDTQKLVLSWGTGEEQIESIKLVVEDENGNPTVLESSQNEGEVFLYEHTFSQGVYHVLKVQVTANSVEKEFAMSELGVDAYFGVGESPSESDKSTHMDMESVESSDDSGADVEASVVTIGENGEVTAEESIASALAENGVPFGARMTRSVSNAKTSNVVVVLDPGHDAGHTGASGNGVREEVATLKIAQYCKEELEQYCGVTVYMTRETAACPYPETVGASQGNILDIQKRVSWAASMGANVFVSFHLNSSTNSSVKGAEVYYPASSSAGQNLAQKIQNELVALGLGNRGAKGDSGYAVVTSSMAHGFPGLIIEHAFMSNSSDAGNYLNSDAKLKKLGVADATGIAKYFGLSKGEWVQDSEGWKYKVNGYFLTDEWFNINGYTYYFDNNGYRVTGWLDIEGYTYYFNSSGKMLKGFNSLGGHTYYFNSTGKMLKGFNSLGGYIYYFNKDGKMQKGFCVIEKDTYYFNSSGKMLTGFHSLGGYTYYFNNSGKMLTGFNSMGGYTYYFTKEGKMLVGKQTIDGQVYNFDEQGRMIVVKEGLVKEDGYTYYYRDGKKQTGFQKIEGYTHYFNSSGKMLTGFHSLGGYTYYFNSSGKMLTGFHSLGGYTYYFNSSGKMLTGFNSLGGYTYYFTKEGRMLVGKQTIDGQEYNFDEQGRMIVGKEGLVKEGGYTYYYKNGEKQKGFQKIEGYTYYFNSSGKMLIGFHSLGGYMYYFNSSGKMLTGFNSMGGYTYYFTKEGKMLVGKQTIDGQEYNFDEQGRMIVGKEGLVKEGGYTYYYKNGEKQKGFQKIEGYTYYFNSSGKMLIGFHSLGGYTYYFNSSGKMLTGFHLLGGYTYYFNSSGKMLTGFNSLDGCIYYFADNGRMQTGWTQIEQRWYFFDDDGVYVSNPTENAPDSPKYVIAGNSTVDALQLKNFFLNSGAQFPEFYKNSDASTLDEFCQIYCEEAKSENIKVEVAFAQAMLETGWLRFGGQVSIAQYNFAGIGAVDGGASGASFNSVRQGVRAQIQHLKAYANKESLNNAQVDPRFHLVTRGASPYVEWLGISENPANKGWASAKNYGYKIIRLIEKM